MSKKLLIVVTIFIMLAGAGFTAYRYFEGEREYNQAYQPEKVTDLPRRLYSLEGDKSRPLLSPMGVIVDKGRIYSTSADGRVIVTDREGKRYREAVVLTGFPPLTSIAASDEGRLYVSSVQKKEVRVFERNGDTVPKGALGGNGDIFAGDELLTPIGLDYHQDHLYVTDVGDHSVKIFNLRGELVKKFGGAGSAAGKFSYPNGVTVAPDGKIFVADSNNARVQIFDRDCRYLETLPQPAAEKDRMLHPRSVAIDKLGRTHVLDTLRGLVHIYSADHEYLFNYGQDEAAGARLRFPNSISIDEATGLIFIADRRNNRLAVWAGK